VIYGRDFVIPDDIKLIAADVLSHRVILKVEEMMEGTDTRQIISESVTNTPAPLEFKRKV
jgi:MoxR-like ATPase